MAMLVDRSLAWADGRRLRDFALGGLLIGLSLGNHALTVFVAPWLILYVLCAGRSTLLEHRSWILAPIAGVFAGAAVYLYIPIAASQRPPLVYRARARPGSRRWSASGPCSSCARPNATSPSCARRTG